MLANRTVRRPRLGRRAAVAAAAVLGMVAVAACGSSSSSGGGPSSSGSQAAGGSGTATGAPIVLFTVAAPEQFPGVGVGLKAAAKAINDAGGVKDPAGGPNRPIKIDVCSDLAGSNAAADCARKAVSEKALAVVGMQSAFSPVIDPIVFKAGIPVVASGAYGSVDLTDPMSFPIINSQSSGLGGGLAQLSKALGLQSIYEVVPNLPQATALLPVQKQVAKAIGVPIIGTSLINVSSTATPDYTPYAAAAAGSGAGAIYMNIGPGGVGLMKALLTQGVDFSKTAVVADTNVIGFSDLDQLGSGKNGVYFLGNSYPASYTANATVKKFNDEIDASGDTKTARGEAMAMAWEGVHIIADLIPKMSEVSSKALVDAMNSAGKIDPGMTPPFDWSQKAFSSGPLAQFRLFTNQIMVSRVVDGKLVPIVDGFQPLDQPFQINPEGKLSK